MQLTAKQEFLKANGIATVQDLSDEILLRFFLEGHGGITNKLSSLSIKRGSMMGLPIDRETAMSMLRQAFVEDRQLAINFIQGETCDPVNFPSGPPHIKMELR